LQIKRCSSERGILFSLTPGYCWSPSEKSFANAARKSAKLRSVSDRLSKLWDVQPILAGNQACDQRADMRQNDELHSRGSTSVRAVLHFVAEPRRSEAMYVVVLHDISDYKQLKAMPIERKPRGGWEVAAESIMKSGTC